MHKLHMHSYIRTDIHVHMHTYVLHTLIHIHVYVLWSSVIGHISEEMLICNLQLLLQAPKHVTSLLCQNHVRLHMSKPDYQNL